MAHSVVKQVTQATLSCLGLSKTWRPLQIALEWPAAHQLAWNMGTIASMTDLLLTSRQSGRHTAMACRKFER